MSTLGDLLLQLRGKQSLRSASKKIGISHTYLDIIEKGVDARSGSPVNPTPDTLKSIAKAYDYPYLELMNLAGYFEESDGVSEEITNITDSINGIGDLRKLVEKYTDEEILNLYGHSSNDKQLTEDQVRKILSYVRFVLSSD